MIFKQIRLLKIFFFFQAEDGIRDFHVTGVQTCALPIFVAQMPVVAKEELLASPVPAVTSEGFGYDPQRGELWFAGETAEALLLELQARRRSLASELDERRARLEMPIPEAAYSVEQDPVAGRIAALAERLVRALEVSVAGLEAPLRKEVDAGAARSGEL